MPRQKGETRNLTFSYQIIDRAISGLNGECFTPKEIYEITGVNKGTVKKFVSQKTKKGFLKRIRYGYYRKVSSGSLIQTLPMAFVATKVFEILRQSDKPLTLREISEIINKNTGLNTYFSIATILRHWCHRNVLDKFGVKIPHAYKIKTDCKNKDRPLVSSPF